jgi:hypothetical protein
MTNDDAIQGIRSTRNGFWEQLWEVSSSIRGADLLVFALILGFGAWQFYGVDRAREFLNDDVFYPDAAQSLIQHGFYGINGYPETNMPPGMSWGIALLCILGGCTHVVILRTMVVFATLGFLGSYELLRYQMPRAVAAAICLLLSASQDHFLVVTQRLTSSPPYFFATIGALLVVRKLEKATKLSSRIGWGALLKTLIAASLMFVSAGIAFLGAIVASIVAVLFWDRRLAVARLRTYLGVLLVGITVQGLWMHQPGEASAGISAQEWSFPGFPHSYMSQLKVKDGRYPELGLATLHDIPVRILKNAYEHGNFLCKLLLQRSIYLAWMSIATIGMLFLIALGWFYSVWLSRGGLQEWYFAGYEFIYFLWPWQLDSRFFLPVAPLACLYVWRAGPALVFLAKHKPRMFGIVWLPMAIVLAINAWYWMHGIGISRSLPNAGLQDEVSFVAWLFSALLAAWWIWADTAWLKQGSALLQWYSGLISALRMSPLRSLQILTLLAVALLIGKGLDTQLRIGRENLDLNSAINRFPPDAQAGVWLRSHSDANAVVMAGSVPTVFHYSNRKVVWFPPSSNPELLMDGILRQRVNFIVVVLREFNYYRPSENDCFVPLLTAYPSAFRVVHEAPEFKIYQVNLSDPPPRRG